MAYGMIKKFGSGLLRLGAKRGDVLGMVVPNFPEFPIAFLGAAGVGVTLTTVNPTRYDEEGQFVIVDRLKELIKVKGLQVAPSELEDLIRRHPGVNDVAVVGVPDDRAGELPRDAIQ